MFKRVPLSIYLLILGLAFANGLDLEHANPESVLQPQSRTFSTLGSLFGGGPRYTEGYRGYSGYGTQYAPGNAYPGAPVPIVPQAAVAPYSGGYGGYGWRGNSVYRGYGAQSGWSGNAPTSGWSGNYGR